MKKILYVITSLAHKRVFESFVPRDDMDQMVIGPPQNITNDFIPANYGDFKIKNIKFFSSLKEQQSIVNSFGPDIYVGASIPVARGIKLPKGCKKVYVNHGMVGTHVKKLMAGEDLSAWNGCDLYCGATDIFADWITHVTGVSSDKIILNAFPQMDLFCRGYDYAKLRETFVKGLSFCPEKIIIFFGFEGKDRKDFTYHNEDYFRTAICLEKIARKNNWMVMIKPRHEHPEIMNFLKSHKWGSKYINEYLDLQKSKHVQFIKTSDGIQRYFFADAVVLNGVSTVEVEACALKKPLFIVQTEEKADIYGIQEIGAGQRIKELDTLEQHIINNVDLSLQQQKWFEIHNLTLDGKMHKRIQDRLAVL